MSYFVFGTLEASGVVAAETQPLLLDQVRQLAETAGIAVLLDGEFQPCANALLGPKGALEVARFLLTDKPSPQIGNERELASIPRTNVSYATSHELISPFLTEVCYENSSRGLQKIATWLGYVLGLNGIAKVMLWTSEGCFYNTGFDHVAVTPDCLLSVVGKCIESYKNIPELIIEVTANERQAAGQKPDPQPVVHGYPQ